jgi:hypothetical protein
VYSFYQDNSSFTVDSASSIGSGSGFLGTVQFSGEFSGSVVTLPYQDETLIVVLLNQSAPGTTSGASDTTTAGAGRDG